VLDPYPDGFAQVRSIVAIGARYFVMAFTSYGVAAFQEPSPALSWRDPWWLLGAALAGLLVWRLAVAVRARSEEAAWWVFAGVSFAPISQIFPFLYPVADRYLYTILPGLLGGAFFLSRDVWARLQPRLGSRQGLALRGVGIALAVVALLLGVEASSRARLWRSETALHLDSARHYPDGFLGTYLRARRAALAGERAEAVSALRVIAARRFDGFHAIQRDPGLASLHGDPGYEAVLAEIAGNWILFAERKEVMYQPDLRMLGMAHALRGEREEALAAMRRALEVGGPFDAAIRQEIQRLESGLPLL
jgi:hypothetical protein